MRFVLVAFLLGYAATLHAQNDSRIDSYVREEMVKRRIPAVALSVTRAGRVQKLSAYGTANVEFGIGATPNTPFNVASVSKAFTAVAVMTLVERGAFALDDPVRRYIDDLPSTWAQVTIRQLLSHTSGLPTIDADPYTTRTLAQTVRDALAFLGPRPMEFEPGASWSYNGTNYLLLGLLVERASGQPFAEFCRQHLFAPIGLNATFGDSRALIPKRASIYTLFRFDEARPKRVEMPEVLSYEMPSFAYPSAGLNISITDFTKWLLALQNGEFISRQHQMEIWTPARLESGESFRRQGDFWTSYGLGWVLNPRPVHPIAGGTGGLRAAFAVYPSDGVSVTVFTNLQGSGPEEMVERIAALSFDSASVR